MEKITDHLLLESRGQRGKNITYYKKKRLLEVKDMTIVWKWVLISQVNTHIKINKQQVLNVQFIANHLPIKLWRHRCLMLSDPQL